LFDGRGGENGVQRVKVVLVAHPPLERLVNLGKCARLRPRRRWRAGVVGLSTATLLRRSLGSCASAVKLSTPWPAAR
jgi:hypothetical protein